MESTGSGVTSNQLASGTSKEEHEPSSPVESPSNLFSGPSISKPVIRNVKGDGDQSGTELRNVARNEGESFCCLTFNFLIPLSLKFQPLSGISPSYITSPGLPREPDLRPVFFSVGSWICVVLAGNSCYCAR